jgi:N-acetylmuramic acid 6-phosphate etherase
MGDRTDVAREQAARFLQQAGDFRLGSLPTEARHPLTYELADLARHDLARALHILKQIDCSSIERVLGKSPGVAELSARVRGCLAKGNRVFLYGCGATGRLSLSLEYLWRLVHEGSSAVDRVRGFMSGGDLALVHSIEDFEDHPEFGARQLWETGFQADDLLISCTEGGETPSVIGATEAAALSAGTAPCFLYCNPDDVLCSQVERSRRVLQDPRIHKLNLYVGPMSLSGSTRLQASTALMLAAGAALLRDSPAGFPAVDLAAFLDFLDRLDISFLIPFVEAESAIYARGEYLLYETNHYGLTILTDTTERAPTFSLLGFENEHDPHRRPSRSFLCLSEAADAPSAWRKILLREPNTLEWEGMAAIAGKRRLLGFDFSRQAREHRQALLRGTPQHVFQIEKRGRSLILQLGAHQASVDLSSLHPLCEHVLLKILLNTHSTLVMGRLGRYESNLMTWVRPSNNKLIDRAIRYVAYLLDREDVHPPFSYQDIACQCFEEMRELRADESVVLKTVAALRRIRSGTLP